MKDLKLLLSDKIESIVELIPHITYLSDLKGNVLYANRALRDLVGLSQKEMQKRNVMDFFAGSDPKKIRRALNKVSKGDEIRGLRIQARISNDKVRFYEVNAAPLREKGKKMVVFNVARDITERKRAEQKLSTSEKRYKELYKNIPLLAYTWQNINDDFVLIDYNEEGEITRNKAGEIKGVKASELYGNRPKRINDMMRCLKEKSTFSKELKYVDKSAGRWKFFNVTYTYVPPDLVLELIEDISERKIAQWQLRKSEDIFRTILESTADGILVVNKNGKILYSNETFAEMWDIPKELMEQKEDKRLIEYVSSQVKNPEVFKDRIQDLYQTKNESLDILHFKDGRIFERYSTPLIHNDTIKGRVWSFRDVTERIKAEKRTKKSLAKSNFYKDLLAHDMANILNNIKTSAQLLEMSRNGLTDLENDDDFLSIITRQVERGSSLISNLRMLSEVEKDNLTSRSIDAKALLKKAIERISSRFQNKKLEITTRLPPEEISVKGGDYLVDAFVNILVNGCVHNDSNVFQLGINVSKVLKAGEHFIRVAFTDNGRGISEERKRSIFERSYENKAATGGMGLGLSLVKKIVEGYGGQVHVENRVKGEYRQGTSFIVLLKEAFSIPTN